MRSKIFDYLPKEDREFIEEWIKVQVEKNTQSYSRFDRFLTFVERAATGVKNAVSGTANWVVETISKIGFHILVANVAYFGLTHGVEWYNGKLIETMDENETLTEQIAEIRKTSKDTFSKLVAEKGAALKLLEEKQAELDNANKRVKSKQAALDFANQRIESKQVELDSANKRAKSKQVELDSANQRVQPKTVQRAATTSNTASSYNRNTFYGCIVGKADTSTGTVYYSSDNSSVGRCLEGASCNDKTGYKLCWIGLRTGKWGSLDEAMRCWDRAC